MVSPALPASLQGVGLMPEDRFHLMGTPEFQRQP